MKKKAYIGVVLLLVSSLLLSACNVPQQGIEKYIAEMAELSSSLDAIDAAGAQGNWEEAQNSLEQAKIQLSNIDAGIDELEEKGIDSTEIGRGKSASAYLHQALKVTDNMLVVHMKIAELEPLMEGVSEGTEEDVAKALDALNELIVIIRNTKTAIENFLYYADNYRYVVSPDAADDAKKLHADTTVPKMEQLYKDLDARESEFEGYIETLSKT